MVQMRIFLEMRCPMRDLSTLAMILLFSTLLLLLNSICNSQGIPPHDHQNNEYYAIQILKDTSGNPVDLAKKIADEHGFTFVSSIGHLDHYFLLSIPKSLSNLQARSDALDSIKKDDRIEWVEQQIPKKRIHKRMAMDVFDAQSFTTETLIESRQRLQSQLQIVDPGFRDQWHLMNTEEKGHDLNVSAVWLQNITGSGVTVAIVDDGVDYTHPDLVDNFSKEGSYDFNHDRVLPMPEKEDDIHGTRCAGEIAAGRNKHCGIGVAYGARVSGIRILSGWVTFTQQAAATTHAYQINDIYSCSWGPPDDGRAMDGPNPIVKDAMIKGITHGRGGKGSIYVFANGNGGTHGDNCNYDGYANSIYTIAVGGINRRNQLMETYSEPCSANLVVTYSGPHQGPAIYTTNWPGHGCTNEHGATSAAAPLASGIIALVLSVRPDLTWRDVQYLLLKTATPIELNDPTWSLTKSGRNYSHTFGYGSMDAYKIVEAAKTYPLLNPQTRLESPRMHVQKEIPQGGSWLNLSFEVTFQDLHKVGLSRLEHVTITFRLLHPRRGDISMNLVSPNGIVSNLLVGRPKDDDPLGFNDWTVMSVKHWDEDPLGPWTIQVWDKGLKKEKGSFIDWSVSLWGESSGTRLESHRAPSVWNQFLKFFWFL